MKAELTIHTDESVAVVQELVARYFEGIGYRILCESPHLSLRRGSLFGSMTGFNPKRWKVTVNAKISSDSGDATVVALVYRINTVGQIVTGGEQAFWNSEIRELELAINTGFINPKTVDAAARTALNQNWRLIVWMLGFIAIYIPLMVVSAELLARPIVVQTFKLLIRLEQLVGTDATTLLVGLFLVGVVAVVLFQPAANSVPGRVLHFVGKMNHVVPSFILLTLYSTASLSIFFFLIGAPLGYLIAERSSLSLPVLVAVIGIGLFMAFIRDRQNRRQKTDMKRS